MPNVSARAYLSDDEYVIRDVPSEKHPDGKTYIVAAPNAADEMLMRQIVKLQDALPPDQKMRLSPEIHDLTARLCRDDEGKEVSFERKMLGPALDEMEVDEVKPRHIGKLAALVMTNYGKSEGMAYAVVAAAEGEALARENRATRRAEAKKPANSPRKAGSKSPRASGGASTRRAPATTRGRGTSARATKSA